MPMCVRACVCVCVCVRVCVCALELQDGVHFSVHFVGDARPPYEYEADTLEEKNKIFRLLSLIVNRNRSIKGKTVRACVCARARVCVLEGGRGRGKDVLCSFSACGCHDDNCVWHGDVTLLNTTSLSNSFDCFSFANWQSFAHMSCGVWCVVCGVWCCVLVAFVPG